MPDLLRSANVERLDEATNVGGGTILYGQKDDQGSTNLKKITTYGIVTVNGTTPVAVVDPRMNSQSIVMFTLKAAVGTPGNIPRLNLPPTATGFTVVADAGDTSVYTYLVL